MELLITELNSNLNIQPDHAKTPDLTKTHTICLNMIVKNESKIITRMFAAVENIIDCYCICDTGSTDATVQIITDYFLEKGIPGKIIHEPFKNFAHNRNVALQGCKGMSDYILLLDADMILKIGPVFDKKILRQDYYHVFQGNDMFYYQNTRIIRNNGLYSYVGVTHEYISTPPNSIFGGVLPKPDFFIHDIGDGGAKSDKYVRDIALLEKGILDEPNNSRYYFYLGNSYRDNGDHEKAIATYKKQLMMPGVWPQEKYCACISVGNIYKKLLDSENAVKYWLKAGEYDRDRIEGVVRAIDSYRNEGENTLVNMLFHRHKGYKRNIAEGKLFVEQDKYLDVLEYNNSISAYYVDDKESGYACIKHILINNKIERGLMKSTLSNMCFYTDFFEKENQQNTQALFKIVEVLLTSLDLNKADNAVWRLLKEKVGAGADATEGKVADVDIEATYQKIKQCRIEAKSHEALALYNTLSKDHPKYANYLWQLAYEYSIFAYYIGVKNINDQIITIFNHCPDESLFTNVLANMKFYPHLLKADQTHDFTHSLTHTINATEYRFNSSSSCIIPYKDGYLMNVRLVNYTINADGCYHGCDQHIITLNKSYELTADLTTTTSAKLIDVAYVDRRYLGIEDVRLFKNFDDTIQFIGTGYHADNKIGVVEGVYDGVYDTDQSSILTGTEIKPAFHIQSECEKNWVYVNYKGARHVIYSWYPLKLCKVDEKYPLLMGVEERAMPAIFKQARGSTCGFAYRPDEIWFVIHLVAYESPRQYYHMLAVFDAQLNLLRYSAPFKFEGEKIEYCLGLVVEQERVLLTYSTWDRTTKIAVYSKKYIEGLTIY